MGKPDGRVKDDLEKGTTVLVCLGCCRRIRDLRETSHTVYLSFPSGLHRGCVYTQVLVNWDLTVKVEASRQF